ncbi:MAG: cyclic nucleotide-binding domain-containing protein [Clostridiales bacterium]|nr:cyclic nucleotide-binding domain-containing protein [Clostridiales bacterium]
MSTIEKSFINGDVIIKEGDSGNTFFQILEGKVGVYKDYDKENETKLATLEQGQYFGEMAVIESYPRSSTIVAEGDVKVLEIAAEELKEYVSQNPDKILAIMTLLGDRITAMTEEYDKAKKALDEARKKNSSDKYSGFFNMMMKQSIYLSSKNFRLEQPSAEALREAADAVSNAGGNKGETYVQGRVIFKEGEVGKCMYILHQGKVGTYSHFGEVNEIKLAVVEPVACFGEMGMLTGEARGETAVSEAEGTQVEIIHPEDLPELFKTSPEKIDMIMKNLSFRLRSITYDYFKACKEIAEYSTER